MCFIHCSQEQFHFLLFGFGKNFQTALFKLSEQCWSLPDGAFADRRHGTSDIFLRFFQVPVTFDACIGVKCSGF